MYFDTPNINAAFFDDNESPFRVSVKTGPDHDGLAACFEGRFQTCPMELLTLATEQPTGIRIQPNLDRGLIRPYHTFPFSVLGVVKNAILLHRYIRYKLKFYDWKSKIIATKSTHEMSLDKR